MSTLILLVCGALWPWTALAVWAALRLARGG